MKKQLKSIAPFLILILSANQLFAEQTNGSVWCIFMRETRHNDSESAAKAEAYNQAVARTGQICYASMGSSVVNNIQIVSESTRNKGINQWEPCWEASTTIRFSCMKK